MFEFLEQYYLVPLVLRNVGQVFDENIKVLIKLPSDVNILTSSSIKIPEPWLIDEFIDVDGYLSKVVRHHKDSKVEENYSFTPSPVDFLYPLAEGSPLTYLLLNGIPNRAPHLDFRRSNKH